jgi:hypothetical protein
MGAEQIPERTNSGSLYDYALPGKAGDARELMVEEHLLNVTGGI